MVTSNERRRPERRIVSPLFEILLVRRRRSKWGSLGGRRHDERTEEREDGGERLRVGT